MIRMYWRPHRVGRIELAIVMLLAVAGVMAVEHFTVVEEQDHYAAKVEAARLTRQAHEAVRAARQAQGTALDPELDPLQTGMLGPMMSPITSSWGSLNSKQISTNPNFGALVVHHLAQLGIGRGDVVAVGVSGSFPAINIAVVAALETLGAEPIVISSTSASQFGANDPEMTWPDMERVLVERQVLRTRSAAVSPGGIEDRVVGVSAEGRALIGAAMDRSGVHQIQPPNYAASVEARMAIYTEKAAGRPIRAYINVGGGTTSVGTTIGKRMFRAGLNRTAPPGAGAIDSVMARFALRGVPVLHMVRIAEQARLHGFPMEMTEAPPIGQGRIFTRRVYNDWLAAGLVVAVLLLMFAFVRRDWGFRMLRLGSRREKRPPPERMV